MALPHDQLQGGVALPRLSRARSLLYPQTKVAAGLPMAETRSAMALTTTAVVLTPTSCGFDSLSRAHMLESEYGRQALVQQHLLHGIALCSMSEA